MYQRSGAALVLLKTVLMKRSYVMCVEPIYSMLEIVYLNHLHRENLLLQYQNLYIKKLKVTGINPEYQNSVRYYQKVSFSYKEQYNFHLPIFGFRETDCQSYLIQSHIRHTGILIKLRYVLCN